MDADRKKLVNDKRKLALEVATLKEEKKCAEARAHALAAKVTSSVTYQLHITSQKKCAEARVHALAAKVTSSVTYQLHITS